MMLSLAPRTRPSSSFPASSRTPRGFAIVMMAIAALGICAGAAQTAAADPQRYEVDPEHFTVGFLVEHIGYAKTLGMFRTARGSFTFDEATGAVTDMEVIVDTASVDTNHSKRDEHLRGKDFLQVDKFPEMRFSAASARKSGDRSYVISGNLTLLGQTRPLELTASWNKIAEYPFGGVISKPYVVGVSARGSFKRSTHGMMYAVENGWVGDEVELILEFEARRQ